MLEKLLLSVLKIALIARVFRELQASSTLRPPKYSNRQILVLELIDEFAPLTEKEIRKMLGLSASTVSEILKKLLEDELITESVSKRKDGRTKPMAIKKPGGEEVLKTTRAMATRRLSYLFAGLDEKDMETLIPLAEKIARAATTTFDQEILNRTAK